MALAVRSDVGLAGLVLVKNAIVADAMPMPGGKMALKSMAKLQVSPGGCGGVYLAGIG
jgi:hypothetical protein